MRGMVVAVCSSGSVRRGGAHPIPTGGIRPLTILRPPSPSSSRPYMSSSRRPRRLRHRQRRLRTGITARAPRRTTLRRSHVPRHGSKCRRGRSDEASHCPAHCGRGLADRVRVGADFGAAIGAAAGAPATGAAVGAGAGLLGGTTVGAGNAYGASISVQRRYDIAYMQCMYAKGNQIPVPGARQPAYTSAASPPPPPPSAPPPSAPPPPGVPPPPAGSPPPPPPGPSR